MECLDCAFAAARLHLYLDSELNTAEAEHVQQHLATCPPCKCRFHFNMRLKKLIRERCLFVHAPVHLRNMIIHLIHNLDNC